MQQIYSGQTIKANRNVVVGTYQSLVKKPKEYFDQFDCVMIDETHKAKSASIKTILQKCVNAKYRYGLSGTIPKPGTLDRLTLMSFTGPVISEVTANFLQQEGHIAGCKVRIIEMDYAQETTKKAFYELATNKYDSKDVFSLEQNYIINNEARLGFITSVISRIPHNSLVLFHRIEHGKSYTKSYAKIVTKKSTMLTEELRLKFEKKTNVKALYPLGTDTWPNLKSQKNPI